MPMSVTSDRPGGENGLGKPSLAMGRVALIVNDLDAAAAFYQRAVGLQPIDREGEIIRLGAGSATLLELRGDAGARRRSPREAGLFHTAFLLPTRADLALWTKNAIETRIAVAGASDHGVSEAIYLTDPEGNGVEIYADRPASQWKRANGEIEMATDPLDIADLVSAAQSDEKWQGFPEGSRIGHVHLQVGALAPADAFYSDVLGLEISARYPGASFYAADGYHHHLAANIWNARGAEARDYPSTGLAEVAISLDRARAEAVRARAGLAPGDPGPIVLADPWGTRFALNID